MEFTSLRDNFTATIGQPTPLEVKIVDDCGNPLVPDGGAAVTVLARFSNRDPDLRLNHIGGGAWTASWRPVNSSASRVQLSVTAIFMSSVSFRDGPSSTAGAFRELTTTCAPAVASACTIDRPIPRVPPVTSATRLVPIGYRLPSLRVGAIRFSRPASTVPGPTS